MVPGLEIDVSNQIPISSQLENFSVNDEKDSDSWIGRFHWDPGAILLAGIHPIISRKYLPFWNDGGECLRLLYPGISQ